MNLYTRYKTDTLLETTGVWQDFGDTRIKLARSGNKNTKYLKTFKEVMKKHNKANIDALSEKEQDELMAEIFIEGVITAWEVKDEKSNWVSGIEMPNDKGEMTVLPFNLKNAKKFLLDVPDLFTELRTTADNRKTFQKEVEETQLKN